MHPDFGSMLSCPLLNRIVKLPNSRMWLFFTRCVSSISGLINAHTQAILPNQAYPINCDKIKHGLFLAEIYLTPSLSLEEGDLSLTYALIHFYSPTDQPNIRVQLHLIGSAFGELKETAEQLRKRVLRKSFKVTIDKVHYEIIPDSFQTVSAVSQSS